MAAVGGDQDDPDRPHIPGVTRCNINGFDGEIVVCRRGVNPRVEKGTNVELGKKMLAESGLNIIAAADMADGAQKVVAAAGGKK